MIIDKGKNGTMKLDNGVLIIQYNLMENSFSAQSGEICFLKEGHFEKELAVKAQIIELNDTLWIHLYARALRKIAVYLCQIGNS